MARIGVLEFVDQGDAVLLPQALREEGAVAAVQGFVDAAQHVVVADQSALAFVRVQALAGVIARRVHQPDTFLQRARLVFRFRLQPGVDRVEQRRRRRGLLLVGFFPEPRAGEILQLGDARRFAVRLRLPIGERLPDRIDVRFRDMPPVHLPLRPRRLQQFVRVFAVRGESLREGDAGAG